MDMRLRLEESFETLKIGRGGIVCSFPDQEYSGFLWHRRGQHLLRDLVFRLLTGKHWLVHGDPGLLVRFLG